jgi:signal transduction histidine kinase
MLEDLQKDQMAANPMIKRAVGSISDTASRMNVRVNDLLDLSRIEQSLDAPAEQIELAPLLGQVLKDLEVEIQTSQARLEVDFSQAPTILSARENAYSLLSNLIGNAIKYRALDRLPEILVQTTSSATETVLKISDNGMGIDLSRHGKKLFGMFNRFHSHVPGTGVGLFIIKKIVERSGGTIHVESTVNIGTTFYIHFPHV